MNVTVSQTGASGTPPSIAAGAKVAPAVLWIGLFAILVAAGFAFSQFFYAQWKLPLEKPSDWGHTFVVPLIALWFVWLRRDELLAAPLRPSFSAVPFLVIGLMIYAIGTVGPAGLIHHLTRAMGVFVFCFGTVGLLAGWASMRVLGFPLLYMFAFGVVISDRIMTPITYELQDIAAQGAWILLYIMGFDTDLAGNTLTIYENGSSYPLNVAEACSGMRMLVAFLALGTAMAYIGLSHWWQRILLILLGVPVAIFVNVLRVVTLGMLSRYDVHFAAGEFHTFVGLVWLVPAFMVFLLLMWLVRKLIVEPPRTDSMPAPEQEPTLRFTRTPTAHLATAVLALSLGAVAVTSLATWLNVILVKKSVPLRASLDTLPQAIGDWKQVGTEPVYGAAIIESLGTTKFVDRHYVHSSESDRTVINLHVAYYTGTIDDVPHIPERCWNASGLQIIGAPERTPLGVRTDAWTESGFHNRASGLEYPTTTIEHPITGRIETVLLPVDDFELMATVFTDPSNPDERHVGGYFFIANGRLTASSFGVRALAFDWGEEYAYYCKVQFSARYELSVSGDQFIDRYLEDVTDLTQTLLPQIMRCLPDWSAIETGNLAVDPQPIEAMDAS